MPDVMVYEVGPRHGLRNGPEPVATASRLELAQRLALAGVRCIEATSFVSSARIPQRDDAGELAALLPAFPGVVWSALVQNLEAYSRFRAAGGLQVATCLVSTRETPNQRGAGSSIDEQLARIGCLAARAGEDGVPLRAYLAPVCGSPHEGEIAEADVVALCVRLLELGAAEVSLGDSAGVAHPAQIRSLVRAVAGEVDLSCVALHLHDTRGRALANIQAGCEEGVRCFDTSLGGLGGCPCAPGAVGRIATEDGVEFLERAGLSTGIDREALVRTSAWVEAELVGRPLSSAAECGSSSE